MIVIDTQMLKELTHQILKIYVPEEKYDYICGMIDMAHEFETNKQKNSAEVSAPIERKDF